MEVNFIFQEFIFDGKSSESYHVIAVFFDRKPDTKYPAGTSTDLFTFFNKRAGTFDIVEQNYSEPMRFTLQIINKDGSDFDTIKERDIKKWLCKRGVYSWLQINLPGYETIFWNVNIANPQVLYVGKVVGMEFECTLNAPFGYSPLVKKEFKITNNQKSFSLYLDTDEDNYIYPYMELNMSGFGNLKITNSSEMEHREFSLENVVAGEKIILDNGLPDIYSSQNGHNIYGDFNKHWIRLAPGNNTLTFNLNCSVLLQYREIRKVGVFS